MDYLYALIKRKVFNTQLTCVKNLNFTRLGILLTVLYIEIILLFRFNSFVKLLEVPLNELGDFLAGVFGPLMLLWVIISVYLQKHELGQNTGALVEQAEELKKSVEQHKDMLNITDTQLSVNIKSLEIQEKIFKQQERDFMYIYEKSNRDITISLDEFECVTGENDKISTYNFYINLGNMIAHLIDFNNAEFNNIESILKRQCLKLIDEEEMNPGYSRFSVKIDENIVNGLLIFGLVRVDYIPDHTSQEIRGKSTISVMSVGPKHRYEFTEKFYKYRYWLEFNGRYNEKLQLNLVQPDI